MAYILCESSAPPIMTSICLGTGRSFDLQALGISDYANLTADNFVCETSSTSVSNANSSGYTWPSGESYNNSYYTTVTKSYNASTGVLTLTGGYLSNSAGKNNGQGQQNNRTSNCTITVWLIY